MDSPTLESYLAEVLSNADSTNRKSGFFIGNTRKPPSGKSSFGPFRESTRLVAGSVVVADVEQAKAVAKFIDGQVDYVFVDAEKKIGPSRWGSDDAGNIERGVRESVIVSRVVTYKANDMAVQALDAFLVALSTSFERGIGGAEVCLLGLGNVGSKIALSLVERGANVRAYRRDASKLSKICEAINLIKPGETFSQVTACSSIREAARDSDLVVALTPGVKVVDVEVVQLIRPRGFIVDAGKGCLTREAVVSARKRGLRVFRADVQPAVAGTIDTILNVDSQIMGGLNRRSFNQSVLVSAGLFGEDGELVVDNANEPTRFYGIADGAGELRYPTTPEERLGVERLLSLLESDSRFR